MKKWLAAGIVLTFLACKVEKTGQDTYKVIAPTPEAKAAGEKAKVEAEKAGEKLKAGAEKLGDKIDEARKDMKTDTTTTTETTSTVTDGTTTATTSTTKTSTHH